MVMDGASVADGQTFLADKLHVGVGGLFLENMKFGGPVDLLSARVDGQLVMNHASVAPGQTFNASELHVTGAFWALNVMFGGPVDLTDAYVDSMDMDDVSIAEKQTFKAERMHVGTRGLSLPNATFGGPVDLMDVHVDGQMYMDGASVADKQTFTAVRLYVGTSGLFLKNMKFGGPVDLLDARVDGQLAMDHASVAPGQTFIAVRLHVGPGGLFLEEANFGGPVDLSEAHIDGAMSMTNASIADQQTLSATELHVGGDFDAVSVTFGKDVNFVSITVDGALFLWNSHVRQLDLEGAVVTNDFVLGGVKDGSEAWLRWDSCDGLDPCLNLRNARIGNLQDDERAWPNRVTLEGFTYLHLGGYGGKQRQDLRTRKIEWWRDWLSRDPIYSTQPYTQLASVLTAAGNREGAADIRFFGRDRERSELLRGCPAWLRNLFLADNLDADSKPCRLRPGLSASALQLFVGYGIGVYAFRAVGWALALAVVGTIILCFAPGVTPWLRAPRRLRQRSLLWCFGASLHRVLPVISLSQEFSDFFNDPERERLHNWQHFAFAVLALCGWVLAAFVAAAFSGLIQS
jgi:hypothetical protein